MVVWSLPVLMQLNSRFGENHRIIEFLVPNSRKNAASAIAASAQVQFVRIANIGTNRGEWWLFTLILFTCLISFTIHDFKNDTEQVSLALQVVAFLQTLPAS